MKKVVSLLVTTILISMFNNISLAETVYETVPAEPVVSYDPSAYVKVDAPASVGTKLHLESNGRDYIDAKQQVNLEPNKQYLMVLDITENTVDNTYFVAVRAKGFLNTNSDILFPKGKTGEHRILFTTASRIRNPYVWSYAYNENRKGADEVVETTFKIYDASLFSNPLEDPLTIQVPVVVEEPVVEEPVVEEPVVEEPVVEEPVVEEPVVEEPVVEEPAIQPVVSFDPANYSVVDSPAYVSDVLHLESNSTAFVDAKYDVTLEPGTEYLIVYDIKANTYETGYFVAVRTNGFAEGNDILFPKAKTGEHRALFTTAATITSPYIWSYAYNNSGSYDMAIETTFDIYKASDFVNPLTAELNPVVEEPVAEEPVAEEPVVEEPVVEEPVAEEPVVEEPVVEEPSVQPVVSFDPARFSVVDSPATVTQTMNLVSSGTSFIDTKYNVELVPNTEYLIVYDLKANTYEAGYFVAVRANGFTQGKDILFPTTKAGEHRALFTTASTITNPYIWSYAYNDSGLADMGIEMTFDIYEAADFADPMNDVINPVEEEPVAEEPVAEEPVVEEPVLDSNLVEVPGALLSEGLVNDPVALETFIDENMGKTILFPANGTYVFNSPLELNNLSNTTIDFNYSTIKLPDAFPGWTSEHRTSNGEWVGNTAIAFMGNNNVNINRLKIDGNRHNMSYDVRTFGIWVDNSTNATFTDIDVQDVNFHGIVVYTDTTDIHFEDVYVKDNYGAYCAADIYIHNKPSDNVSFNDVYAERSVREGLQVYYIDGYNSTITNLHVQGASVGVDYRRGVHYGENFTFDNVDATVHLQTVDGINMAEVTLKNVTGTNIHAGTNTRAGFGVWAAQYGYFENVSLTFAEESTTSNWGVLLRQHSTDYKVENVTFKNLTINNTRTSAVFFWNVGYTNYIDGLNVNTISGTILRSEGTTAPQYIKNITTNNTSVLDKDGVLNYTF